MGIDPTKICHSNTSFKGVMPCLYANCTGSVLLEVVFGSSDNLHGKKLIFHIAPFKSSHQALLGREAFARFNAIPHYASLTVKMPGPRGIISLKGNSECSSTTENVRLPRQPHTNQTLRVKTPKNRSFRPRTRLGESGINKQGAS